jgi:hypothetical protein
MTCAGGEQRPLLRHDRRRLRRHARLRPLPNGGTCGGTGYDPNVCNDPTCKKVSCTPMGGQYCGVIGNGCGGTQDCGACANGDGLPDQRREPRTSARDRPEWRCRPATRRDEDD